MKKKKKMDGKRMDEGQEGIRGRKGGKGGEREKEGWAGPHFPIVHHLPQLHPSFSAIIIRIEGKQRPDEAGEAPILGLGARKVRRINLWGRGGGSEGITEEEEEGGEGRRGRSK